MSSSWKPADRRHADAGSSRQAAATSGTLTKALVEGRREEKRKHYTVPRLLITDEIGCLSIERQGANLFFQLISRRCERGPMVLTSNQSFGAWGEVFGNRVLHHAITINIRGNSCRLKERVKARLVRRSRTCRSIHMPKQHPMATSSMPRKICINMLLLHGMVVSLPLPLCSDGGAGKTHPLAYPGPGLAFKSYSGHRKEVDEKANLTRREPAVCVIVCSQASVLVLCQQGMPTSKPVYERMHS